MNETPAPKQPTLGQEAPNPSMSSPTGQDRETMLAGRETPPPEVTVGPRAEAMDDADPPSECSPKSDAEIATARDGSDATRRGLLSGTFDGKPGSPARFFKDYELLAEIGRGGMGVVYKAKQIGLNRLVALKMILAGQLASETAVQRFYREAQSAASLDHPNIVPIYEIGEHDNRHYFSMAFVDGLSLADSAKKNPMSMVQAVRVVKQVAESVHYAHEKGIVHRDLKPANILIDGQGRPRVTDFGLAKQIDDDSNLTATGHVMGTPCYMSPEQAKGISKEIGPGTDIYSLGGILYRLLTGKPPFLGNSQTETLVKVLHEDVTPARQHNPDVPEELDLICQKCLAKKREDRFANASELADALGAWLREAETAENNATLVAGSVASLPSSSPRETSRQSRWKSESSGDLSPSPSGPRPPWGLIALGMAAIVVLATGAYVAMDQTEAIPPTENLAAVDSFDAGKPVPAEPVSSHVTSGSPHQDVPQPHPGLATHPLDPSAAPLVPRNDFKLEVRMIGSREGSGGERILDAGQPVKFEFQVAKDSHVGVWVVSATGTVLQLFPTQFETDNLVKAGEVRVVPGNAKYDILSDPSEGPEYVRVIASTAAWNSIEGTPQGVYMVFESAEQRSELQGHLRGLVIQARTEKTEISEAIIPFQVLQPNAP